MSDEIVPIHAVKLHDFTPSDRKKIEKFKEAGLPGIATMRDDQVIKAMDLYQNGKTYEQIAMILGVKKEIILFFSEKFEWYPMKMEFSENLAANIMERTLQAKIITTDFLLQLKQFWETRIGKNINKYLATGEEQWAEKIDYRDVDKYLKTVELLNKTGEARGDKLSPIGLNVGEGGLSIKKTLDGVEITPKQKSVSEQLSKLADFRRQEENRKNSEISDINKKIGEKKNV